MPRTAAQLTLKGDYAAPASVNAEPAPPTAVRHTELQYARLSKFVNANTSAERYNKRLGLLDAAAAT